MSTWCNNDKNGFVNSSINNLGQINTNTMFGNLIKKYAEDEKYLTYLEIGTWNGMGSTKCFKEGFDNRKDKNYQFYSLECNKDKSLYAKQFYKNDQNIHILNEVIYNIDMEEIYKVFPILKNDEMYNGWHKIDIENMKNCNLFFERKDIPEFFDIVLLDGGEFTTYFEFKAIENKCKILMLDDTNTFKCHKILEEITSNPDKWKILFKMDERNGFMIAEKL